MNVSALSITDQKGHKEKSIRIFLGKTMRSGASDSTYISVPLEKIDAFSERLHDVMRIGKTWERKDKLEKDKSLNFDLTTHVSLLMHEDEAGPYGFSIRLTYGSYNIGFDSLDNYSQFLANFDEYVTWVKKQ